MPRSLWTTPIASLTADDVRAFCALQKPEGQRIEYKSDLSSNDAGKQVAKIVVSFANTHGGLLIIGVLETPPKSGLPEREPEGRDLGIDPHGTIVNICAASIFPPFTPEISAFIPASPGSKEGFVVVRTTASPIAPHACENDTGIYVRTHDHAKPARPTLDRLTHLIENRKARIAVQTERVRSSVERISNALEIQPVAYRSKERRPGRIAFALGPTMAGESVMSWDEIPKPPVWFVDGFVVREGVIPTVDGFYITDAESECGSLLDGSGNVVVAMRRHHYLCKPMELPTGSTFTSDWVSALAREDKRIDVLVPQELLRPLVALLVFYRNHIEKNQLTAALKLTVFVDELIETPIGWGNWMYGTVIAAANRTDKAAEFSFDFQSAELSMLDSEVPFRAARKLFGAWGARISKGDIERVLEEAELKHFGRNTICKMHGTPDPNFVHSPLRSSCLQCRRAAIERAEEEASARKAGDGHVEGE